MVQSSRRVILLEGCVQSVLAPRINAAAARVLDRLDIGAVPAGGCCGAISQHLSAEAEARSFMRANIDRWWPAIEDGAEAIVSTASGCGTMVKDYGYLLREDPDYAAKAARVAALTRDISEVLAGEPIERLRSLIAAPGRIAFHAPCSLQHGQKLSGQTERLLSSLGFVLTPVRDAHLCCGSAGTYSILQASLARRLVRDKVLKLEEGQPDLIATANIGCHHYLQSHTDLSVVHWVELLIEGNSE
jgi:glycolate oxidase iron-sulfur subunit